MVNAWAVTIDGQEVELHLSVDAMLAIEQETGRTIFQHVDDAVARAVSLRNLGIILRCMAGEAAPVPSLRGLTIVNGFVAPLTYQGDGERVEDTIVRNGIIDVMASVMLPLVAALKGTPSVTNAHAVAAE